MIKAVAFDLDDTLYAERDYVLCGFRLAAERLCPESSAAAYKKMTELFEEEGERVFHRFFADYPDGNRLAAQAVELYRRQTPHLRPYPDVLPCFAALRARGLKLGLITDGRPVSQNGKIDGLNIRGLFDCVIVTDALGGEQFRKPSYVPYERLCAQLSVAVNELMYVGDNPVKDFYIGTKGATTVRVMRPQRIHPDGDYFGGIKETYRVDNLKNLEEYI